MCPKISPCFILFVSVELFSKDVPLSEMRRCAHCVGGGLFNYKTILIGFKGFNKANNVKYFLQKS